ncbi:MAG: type II secretion system protein [Dehalococcoidales bacterium]|nr:type II secretion system protein [Dehalococcoidales bacterium]
MKNEKGFTLIGVMIALLLLGIIAVALLGALATASNAIFIADERATAESLARTEMEYIKNCEYEYLSAPWSYELPSNPPSWDTTHALPAGYDGYSLTVDGNLFDADGDDDVDPDDEGIQKIIVTVKHHDKEVITLENYKVER